MHHCPGSGIRANKADNSTIRGNLVYGNTWWTVSASSGEEKRSRSTEKKPCSTDTTPRTTVVWPSGVVFAESEGAGVNLISGNVVFGNRNFMPFFYYQDINTLAGGHSVRLIPLRIARVASGWGVEVLVVDNGLFLRLP